MNNVVCDVSKKLLPQRIRRLLYIRIYLPVGRLLNFGRLTEVTKDRNRGLELAVYYICKADVVGDIAEFGTASGHTALVISQNLARYQNKPFEKYIKRTFHLFDSFVGMPKCRVPQLMSVLLTEFMSA